MANTTPKFTGVQSSEPTRQMITFSGDGGICRLLGDLLTLRQFHLHVKVIAFNNGALGFVKQEMKAAGVETYATEFKPQTSPPSHRVQACAYCASKLQSM